VNEDWQAGERRERDREKNRRKYLLSFRFSEKIDLINVRIKCNHMIKK